MNKINNSVLVLAIIALLCGTASAATTIYVGPGEANAMIQGAVNNATSGDTIIVRDGPYNENVNVGVTHLTIQSENGSANCFVNASDPDDHVFNVSMFGNYTNISGFTIRDATGDGAAGIYLGLGVDYCNIADNIVSNSDVGISTYHSNNNTITDNTVNSNDCGVRMEMSRDNTLQNNIVNSNEGDGIYLSMFSDDNVFTNNTANLNDCGIHLHQSNDNAFTDNIANSNDGNGIYLSLWSSNNTFTDNTVNSNDCGVRMEMSRDNTLQNNIVNSNEGDGIYLSMFSDDNVFTNNTANLNDCGIHLHQSNDNAFTDNIANSNDGNGTYLSLGCSNNTFTNNTANSNDCGIRLRQSNNNTFTKNTVSSNDYGIRLYQSNNNSITCNGVCNNAQRGLHLFLFSRDNSISYNNIIANGDCNATTGGWEWQFVNDQSNDVEARHNYWGAGMNNTTIDASLHDDDEGILGEVKFYPFETEPVTCAPTHEETPAFTTTDAAIALQIAVGNREYGSRWDVNSDGRVTSLDALMILQAATGNGSL